MSEQQPTFAETFERLRLGRGWSPAEVARQLGVYPTEVSRWRHGRGGISINNVRKVAALFDVDPTWLERLAGYGASHSDATLDTLDSDRQMWRSRYDYLIENKVPWAFREAYFKACEALAEAYHQMQPGALNEGDAAPLIRSDGEIDEGSSDSESGGLAHCYRPSIWTYQNETPSLVVAHAT
jgi:transcriptional regulator with XRE-family HTH domain